MKNGGMGNAIARILIVDDDPDLTNYLSLDLKNRGYETVVAGTSVQALSCLRDKPFDLVVLDVILPDRSGIDTLREIKSLHPSLPILMLSGREEVSTVVSAMKEGASDYLAKPAETAVLARKLEHLLNLKRKEPVENSPDVFWNGTLAGKSRMLQNLLTQIKVVMDSDAPVLIHGETGTGKSLVAQMLHQKGLRREKPFVAVNCAAIPAGLLESELFGHERGAFTGAIAAKKGTFERADGGTLFLDEIGEMPVMLQPKLLHALQNREFDRVGGHQTIRVDIRVITATNRNLEEAIRLKEFREDLFYRLNVLPLYMPSLSERREDIPLLARQFASVFSQKYGKKFSSVDEEDLEKLSSRKWPGNIRELENIVERAVVFATPPVLRFRSVLAERSHFTAQPPDEPVFSLAKMERKRLLAALDQAGGNITRVAEILGISRDTVYRRLNKHGIELK